MGKKVAIAGLALGAASLMSMQAQDTTPVTPATTIEQPSRPIVDAALGDTTAVVIRGKVIDKEDQEPVIGATILLKGTKLGTATDMEGNFAIRVPQGSILAISCVGYEDREYVAKKTVADEVIVIAIDPKAVIMGEVMIVRKEMPAVDADIYMPQ